MLHSHPCTLNWLRSNSLNSLCQNQSQSHSKSWCRAPSGAHVQIFITVLQLRSCSCGAPSLTRGRVCLLYMLLALVNAVLRVSESHILLSQIWNFPFHRLLRLAGSQWRYSTPPPHGSLTLSQSQSHIATDGQSVNLSWPDVYCCLTVTVLLLWGALSDESTDLSFVRVIVCINKSYDIM
jgi:hypothetical protein